jgi:hypothetical protein
MGTKPRLQSLYSVRIILTDQSLVIFIIAPVANAPYSESALVWRFTMLSKFVIARLSVFMLILTSLFIVPATSHASANGIAYWDAFNVKIGDQSVPIPSGQLLHVIKGKGYYIEWDGANFASAANICDPSMRFTYGNGAYRLDGNVHWGCSLNGQWKYYLKWNAPRGSACAELWAKNWRILVAKQCHYIHG